MKQTLQDNHMFTHIHLIQKKNWHSVRKAIATHTNSFSKQQEQKGIISPNKKMIVTSLLHQLNAKNLTGGIIIKKKIKLKQKLTHLLLMTWKCEISLRMKMIKRGMMLWTD